MWGGITAMQIWIEARGNAYLVIKKQRRKQLSEKITLLHFYHYWWVFSNFATPNIFASSTFSAFFFWKKLNVLGFMVLLLTLHLTWKTFYLETCSCVLSSQYFINSSSHLHPCVGIFFFFLNSWMGLTWFYHLSQAQLPMLGQFFPRLSAWCPAMPFCTLLHLFSVWEWPISISGM